VIVVNSTSFYRTLVEFINAARAKPGETAVRGCRAADLHHIGFEMLRCSSAAPMVKPNYLGPLLPGWLPHRLLLNRHELAEMARVSRQAVVNWRGKADTMRAHCSK
jgi:hypothetical protein